MTVNDVLSFKGFSENNLEPVRVPAGFFNELLPQISDINELRLLLYIFWHLEQQDSTIRYLRFVDLSSDAILKDMLGDEESLRTALSGLVSLNIILVADLDWMDEKYYFLNSPQGRAAIKAIGQGQWQNSEQQRKPIHLAEAQPNIFKLYEENIGAITPMMAEILKDDEINYPVSWIEEAIEIAVTRNARNWKYIQMILERWKNEGRGHEQNRRDDKQDPETYRRSWLRRK